MSDGRNPNSTAIMAAPLHASRLKVPNTLLFLQIHKWLETDSSQHAELMTTFDRPPPANAVVPSSLRPMASNMVGDLSDGRLHVCYWPSMRVTRQRGSGLWERVCENPYAHGSSAHSQSPVIFIYWFVLSSPYVYMLQLSRRVQGRWDPSSGLFLSLTKYTLSEECYIWLGDLHHLIKRFVFFLFFF